MTTGNESTTPTRQPGVGPATSASVAASAALILLDEQDDCAIVGAGIECEALRGSCVLWTGGVSCGW